MKNIEIIVTTPEQIYKSVKKAITEHETEKEKSRAPKLYTVNQVSKLLKKSYNTIRKYIDQGYLKTTRNGLITENSINEFLENK